VARPGPVVQAIVLQVELPDDNLGIRLNQRDDRSTFVGDVQDVAGLRIRHLAIRTPRPIIDPFNEPTHFQLVQSVLS